MLLNGVMKSAPRSAATEFALACQMLCRIYLIFPPKENLFVSLQA